MGNPWKALSSYDINDKCCFCGRDEDIVKLCSLIEYNQVVTIYGKSGIGKTSLLKAGVYPQLLIGDYLPKFIRFGEYEDDERSYAEIIHSVLPKKNIDLAEKNIDYTAKDFFCQFFKENEILDDNGNQVIPVIILDQFEELFDERQGRIDLLLQQIVEWKNYSGKMVSDCHFVFSIREDDLYLLEEMIDNYRYNSLKNCRYRVRRVTRKGAEEIIQIPGKDYIRDEEVVSKILDLIGAGQNKEYYEASELSLMCSMLYNAMNNRSEKSITMELVEKIGISSVVDYYENGVKGISAKEKIILEKEFIKDEGRRNFISEEDFKDLFKSAKTRESLISGDNKILSIANGKVEIIHDMLAKAIFKTKLQRVKKEKIRALEIVAWIVIMFLFGGALWKAVDNVSISKNTITYLNEDHINNCPSKRIECIASGYISISNCYDLEHLVIKDSITGIIIRNCPKLSQIEFEGDSIYRISVKNCPNLKYLNIPDNVGVIDDSNCENTYIQKVIPNNKHYVWLDDVLWNINQRKIIYLPRRKKNTETLFPYECKDMKIALCKNDTIYNSSKWIDNILFDKDTTKIMGYHSPMDSILDLNKYKKLNSIVEHAFNGNQDIKKLILSNSCEYGEYAFANCAIDTIITANQSCLTPLFTYNNKNRITYIIDNIDGYIKDKGIIRNDKGNAVLLSSEYKGDFYTEKSMNGDTLYLFVHGYNAAIVGGKIYHSGTLNDENIIKRCEFVGFRYIYSDMSNKNVIISPYPYLDCSYLSSNAQEIRIISESAHSKTNIINLPDSLRRNIRLYVPPGHLQKYLSDYGFKSVIEYDYFRYACELINNKIHLSGDYFSRHPVEFCLIILGLMIIGFIFYILCLNETAYILSKKARFFAAFGKMLRMVFLGLMWYIASYWIVFYTIMDSKLLSNCIAIPSTLLVLALFYYNVLYAIKDIGWKKLFDRLFLTIRREIQRYRRICRILLLSFIISFSLFEYFNYLDTYQQQILSVAQECYNKGKYNDALKVVISGLSSHFIQGDSIAMNILKYDNSVELGGHTRRVNSACFSFDGKYIVTASDDKTAILWNASTYEIVDTLLGHTRGVNSACFSFDGKYIATASDDRTTKVWNVESREVIATLQHRESVNTAFFSSDSKYIVTASDGVSLQKDNVMVRIWETSTGKLLKVFKGHILDVNSAFFSPNDKYVITASSDHTAKIWDAETGELIKTLDKHRGDVNSAFLSFDGKLIVTASDDEKVMIWDASTFEIIETLKGYDLWGGIASFSSDGKLVIAASDKSAIMWIIDPSLLYEHCKKLVEKNPLSEEEREKYGIKWWMKW